MEKPILRHPVVVEGKYDQIKLSSLFEGQILTTEGFGIFKNEEKKAFFRRMAERTPLIVFTDSDGAGLVIRNYFRSILPADKVIHLYIPQVQGKEARKSAPSKEGFLGVEGIDADFLRSLFAPYTTLHGQACSYQKGTLTRMRLYELGYEGGENSREKRQALLARCGLPRNLSTKAMVEALNLLYGDEELEKIL